MIELTVKTLDSQNHAFSVPDDTTVKQLKERIAESISFPVESQRLIYCGRVLQDEKNLSEYDVNGKVIHLVQRPPPQATRSNGGQQRSTTNQQGRRGNHHFRQPRLDGNAMYLGAMAFPADLMDAQAVRGIQAPPSSHSLSDSRLLLARRMLRRATVVLNRLENPTPSESSDPDSPPEEQQEAGSSSPGALAANAAAAAARAARAATRASAAASVASAAASAASAIAAQHSSTSSAVDDAAGGDESTLQNLDEGQLGQDVPLSQATHAATAAAIAAAVSAAHAAGVPNITIVRSGQSGSDVDVRMEADDDLSADTDLDRSQSTSIEASAHSSAAEGPDAQEGTSAQAESVEGASAAPATSSQSGTSNDEVPRTTVLAVLLDELNRVNQRLQPFMQQYHTLMREYPNPENNATTTQESQRVFSSVSEIMHFLSHAYHALSDIMCDFSQPPPRALRCRPVLIQHSAVLQAGIPIQAQINVMTNRNNPNNNNNISTNNNGASSSVGSAQGAAQTAASTVAAESRDVSQEVASNTASQENNTTASGSQEEARNRETRENPEPAFNITPGNVEFFMEVGPGSITIDSLEATVVTNSGSMGGDSLQANVVGGSFPWGAPPPPEFIQNLMQAVAGHMIGRGGTAPSSTTTTTATTTTNQGGSGANTGAAAGGQNSQARGNTATHPTTATQTRSTSRPHVHLAPATMQGLGSSSFDPFLPCNSHHIRSRARHNAQSLSQQFAAAVGASAEAPGSSNDQDTSASTAVGGPVETQQSRPAEGQPSVQSSTSANQQGSGLAAAHTQSQTSNSSQQHSAQNSQSQSTPNAQSSSQSGTQGQQQQSVAGLLNMLSNIVGNWPTLPSGGAAATVNLSNLFQPMMVQAQQRAGAGSQASSSHGTDHSSGSQTSGAPGQSGGVSGGTSPFPPGMAFFNLSGQRFTPQTPRQQPQQQQQQPQQQSQQQAQQEPTFFQRLGNQSLGARDTVNNPVLSLFFQGMSSMMGSDVFNIGNLEGNLADFLMTDGQYGYYPGTSLILDFLMTMGRNMNFGDIINLTFGNGESLNRIRPQMRQFLLETAFENQPVNSESTSRVVERFVQEIRPHLQIMQQARVREDVDLVTTTIRYNQIRLSELISLIVEGNQANFGQCMMRWFTRYFREISAIVLHCCLDGEQGFDKILRDYLHAVEQGLQGTVAQRARESDGQPASRGVDRVAPYVVSARGRIGTRYYGRQAFTGRADAAPHAAPVHARPCLRRFGRPVRTGRFDVGGERHCSFGRGHIVISASRMRPSQHLPQVEVTRGVHPALQIWTTDSFVTHMQGYMRRQNVPFDEIREYLVYRGIPVQSDTTHQSSSAPSSMKTDHSSTPTPEPMDTDPSPDESSATLASEAGVGMQEESNSTDRDTATPTEDTPLAAATLDMEAAPGDSPARESVPPKRVTQSPLSTLTVEGETLPDVVLGSEAWHNVLPSEWVPIIARDSQRQRRQNPQAPFSDAYLSGMPSKRRKVVATAKPQGNINQIITDGMRSALDEAGVRPVAGVETAGEDLELQAAYREQVRSVVQDSLSSNPDFTPERFPNASKYFSK